MLCWCKKSIICLSSPKSARDCLYCFRFFSSRWLSVVVCCTFFCSIWLNIFHTYLPQCLRSRAPQWLQSALYIGGYILSIKSYWASCKLHDSERFSQRTLKLSYLRYTLAGFVYRFFSYSLDASWTSSTSVDTFYFVVLNWWAVDSKFNCLNKSHLMFSELMSIWSQ